MSTLHLKNLAQGAIKYLANIFNLSISTGQIPEIWHKAIIDNPDSITRQGLATNYFTVTSGQNAGKAPVDQNTDTHPFPPRSTWHSVETLDMHCTVDDHRRHCCRLLKKNAGSPTSARRARSDSCIRQCGPSTTSPLCLQHQHTGNNPSLALQLYAEQMSQSSF